MDDDSYSPRPYSPSYRLTTPLVIPYDMTCSPSSVITHSLTSSHLRLSQRSQPIKTTGDGWMVIVFVPAYLTIFFPPYHTPFLAHLLTSASTIYHYFKTQLSDIGVIEFHEHPTLPLTSSLPPLLTHSLFPYFPVSLLFISMLLLFQITPQLSDIGVIEFHEAFAGQVTDDLIT